MSESISSTVKHSGLTLDSVFVEVQHSEGLDLPKSNHIKVGKEDINTVVTERAHEVRTGTKRTDVADAPMVPPGAMVRHVVFGVGQVVGLMASFPGCQTKAMEVPYLRGLPDEISMEADGKTLHHERFGEGSVYAYIIVFDKMIMSMSYPSAFTDSSLFVK